MQYCDITHTRLDAQDLLATLNYRGTSGLDPDRGPRTDNPPLLHDFLVLNQRPDLTPDLASDGAGDIPQSWERNIPQK